MKYIEERSSVINPLNDYDELLKSKKKLRIKLGVDPTAPDVTLGWYAILRSLRKFQEYGHTAVLILGEFTAQVGDPSGKSETRSVLDSGEIDKNSKGVLPVIKSILHEDNLEIVSNKEWLSKLSISDMMNLASSTTLAQMLEREDFSKRYDEKNPISLLEFFYPLFQGYDSVAIKADIEIGGNDQLWNLMLGREIQKYYNLKPQVAVTFPLLVGTDGKKKMSQSLDNYISVKDTPENIYGKIMSIPDDVMWDYFLMLTDLEIEEINETKALVLSEKLNPFDIKKSLGKIITNELYDEDSALLAEESFSNITINKNVPINIPEIIVDQNDIHLPNLLTENLITKSNSEARRIISSGGFKINDVKYTELDISLDKLNDSILQIGKRKFLRINKK
ncbi:MAG: tyrosine--tRNA ligase [Candidatus Actinomarina sp.]|nr:tyrosine--tRNA ligase [Actinomycetota bacterium]MBL6833525.1 tyrosine--tRNA ligase [Candidatus Actinomarina sp.]MBL6836861.1 tyrosine--tRNA ligase [Candidatus Actinomarina sp.]